MCFAQQRRAFFRHLNFQKWSGAGVLYILTWKCASRHNGVRFFDISISKSGPNVFLAFLLAHVLRATTACNFSSHLIWPDGFAPGALASLLLDPPEPQIIGKTQCLATFPPFRAPASSFFWLFLFSDLHIVRSLTSKLPPIIAVVVLYPNHLKLSLNDVNFSATYSSIARSYFPTLHICFVFVAIYVAIQIMKWSPPHIFKHAAAGQWHFSTSSSCGQDVYAGGGFSGGFSSPNDHLNKSSLNAEKHGN